MRQTLFYIPESVLGMPLFGFGLLFWGIVVAFAVSLVVRVARRGTKRPGRAGQGDDWGTLVAVTAVSLFFVAFVFPGLAADGGFPVRGYGFFLMLAILASTGLVLRRARRKWNLPSDVPLSVAIVAVVFGILGARVFFVVEYWNTIVAPDVLTTVKNIVDVTSGGLVVYGSILGGILAMLVYLRARKLPILATFDLFAPALMLGIAFGRLGCLMNGCCFGAICESPWGITFPPGSPAHVHQLETGEASLAGFFVKPSNRTPEQADRTLFSLKRKERSLWTDEPGTVVIASVDEGSPAAKAGLKPDMTIRMIGFLDEAQTARTTAQSDATLYPVHSNADIFRFLYSAMTKSPRSRILVVCDYLKKTPPASGTGSGEEPARTRFAFLPDYATAKPVIPSQIVSSLSALLACLILLALDRFVKRDGVLFATMLALYAINRFALELLRVDEASFMGSGLSVAQCVSLAVFVAALCLFVYVFAKPPTLLYSKYIDEKRPNESPER